MKFSEFLIEHYQDILDNWKPEDIALLQAAFTIIRDKNFLIGINSLFSSEIETRNYLKATRNHLNSIGKSAMVAAMELRVNTAVSDASKGDSEQLDGILNTLAANLKTVEDKYASKK